MVATKQRRRHGRLVEGSKRGEHHEPIWLLTAIAKRAFECRPDARAASRVLEHPASVLEGWTVTDVLVVPARQFRDPPALVVAVEVDDLASHRHRRPQLDLLARRMRSARSPKVS
jgi:hypothetical protein